MVRQIADHRTSEAIITNLGAQGGAVPVPIVKEGRTTSVSLPQHELIIAAIIARDPDAASTAMEQHLRSVARAIADGEAG